MTSELNALDRSLAELVEREIAPGERVVWAAQPIPRWFAPGAIGATLFMIPWTAFAVLWTVLALLGTHGRLGGGSAHPATSPTPSGVAAVFGICFPLWGLIFVGFGVAGLTAPLRTRTRLKRTAYVITDRRAIVLRPERFGARVVETYSPNRLTHLQRRERRDGSGDLVFEAAAEPARQRSSRQATAVRGFLSVADVSHVERTLRDALLDERERHDDQA